MRNAPRAAALLAAAIAGAALAGCGGSSPAGTPDTPATPHATPAPASPAASPSPPATPAPPRQPSEAEALYRAGDYDGAAAAFEALARAAASTPARADALVGLAVARRAGGQLEAALAAASDAAAIAEPGSPAALRAAFLRGRYLADAGSYEEAIAVLQPLAEAGAGLLQPYVLIALQQAALGTGDGALAASASHWLDLEADVPTAVRDAAQRRNVEAARLSGDLERYAAELAKLVAISGYARDRFALADVCGQLGRESERLAELRRIVVLAPSDPLAAAAVDLLEQAGEQVNGPQKGFIYYRARRYVDAIATLGPVVQGREALAPADQAFATYYLAAALEDYGNLSDAVFYYDQVPGLAPGSPYAHRARYWAARVMEWLEDYRSASARYVELVRSDPSREYSEESAFRAGYVLYAASDPAGAIAAWDSLLVQGARVLFWRGMAQRDLGDFDASRASFAAATAAGPLDFHGVEAARMTGLAPALDVRYRRRELDPPVDWAAIEAWVATRAPGSPQGPPSTAAAELAALGLRDEAEETLLAAAPAGSSPWVLLAVAREAHRLGLRGTAARLADLLRIGLGAGWGEAPRALLAVGYPVDFGAVLDAEARAGGLDPLLLAALVRVESYWEPSAVSPAGALGLTQVMPATGAAIADALGVEDFSVDSLLRPATSLRFGAYYIAEQIRTFGHAHVALAAYNGGPGRAARWANAWDGQSAASFAETVDIDETRFYVELVLEAYARYAAAYPEVTR